MNRKTIALSLSLCLLAATFVGVVAQTYANATTNTATSTAKDSAYGEHGEVVIQLPPPLNATSHPTNLRLIATSYDNRSDFGTSSCLIVLLWIPATNQFVPVAHIKTNPDPSLDTYLQSFWNGTSVWNPLMHNIITVSSQALNVWRDGSLIVANLTTPVTITLPFNLMTTASAAYGNLTFVLPPLTLTFHPIGSPVPLHEASVLPSGYTNDVTSLMNPAWVRVDIPTWVKGSWLEYSGHICTNLVQIESLPTI
jgi:hypothetical protein